MRIWRHFNIIILTAILGMSMCLANPARQPSSSARGMKSGQVDQFTGLVRTICKNVSEVKDNPACKDHCDATDPSKLSCCMKAASSIDSGLGKMLIGKLKASCDAAAKDGSQCGDKNWYGNICCAIGAETCAGDKPCTSYPVGCVSSKDLPEPFATLINQFKNYIFDNLVGPLASVGEFGCNKIKDGGNIHIACLTDCLKNIKDSMLPPDKKDVIEKALSHVESLREGICKNGCGILTCQASDTIANACNYLCCPFSNTEGEVKNCLKNGKTCGDYPAKCGVSSKRI